MPSLVIKIVDSNLCFLWKKWRKITVCLEEYVHVRGKMNSNRYKISFRLKISLRCSVNSLFVFTWIEAKWNSKRYGSHIGHCADSLDVAINAHVCLKLNGVWISYWSLWQKSNFISGDKYHVNTTWNEMQWFNNFFQWLSDNFLDKQLEN